jgi:anti-sigma B factor antagonist
MEDEAPGEFTMTVRGDGPDVVVEMSGEFDLHAANQVGHRLGTIVDGAKGAVEVDATGVTFIDSAGLHALLTARDRARDRGVSFQVGPTSPQVASVIEITGVSDLLSPGR